MFPSFANPLGFLLLLGLPAVIAIHYLQQRSRTLRTATLFLLEQQAPESRSGRTWDRLRNSRALWCQLLSVLLATWVLVEPRWLRPESTQTVVIVLDQSASMSAFRGAAHRALREQLNASGGFAARTTWVVMSSDSRLAPFYRGANSQDALAAFQAWQPALGTHDIGPSLRLAHSLAGQGGQVWFITDTREGLPEGQATIGVGRPIPNLGFAGFSLSRDEGRLRWRAFVRNYSDTEQKRAWWIESDSTRSPEKQLSLAPGALVELGGLFPGDSERCTVVLAGDAFAADDRLPLLRPSSKKLGVSIQLEETTGAFFKKLVASVDGLSIAPKEKARLVVTRLNPHGARPTGPAILLSPERKGDPGERLSLAPRVPARHPLMSDLNWQAWLGLGAEEMRLLPGDTPLLWQAEAPLICLGAGSDDERKLIFNFDWHLSNAARLPATVLLVRRFLEGVRDAQAGAYSANFDCAASVPIAARDQEKEGACLLEFQPDRPGAGAVRRPISTMELGVLRAPDKAGTFVLSRGGEQLVRGATQFSDARESNFQKAESFVVDAQNERTRTLERNTRPDPCVQLWLGLLGLCLLGSWWPGRRSA
jgi:hypothetical protein